MATRTLFVIDRQNLDETWTGVASIWDEVSPDVLADILDAFKTQDQTRNYRLVQKVSTFEQEVTVIG